MPRLSHRLAVILAFCLWSAEASALNAAQWSAKAKELANLPESAQLLETSRWVHAQVRYERDGQDTWSAPLETLQRGHGDCEDFALAKYALLRSAGWKESRLRLGYGFIPTAGAARSAHLIVLAETDGAGTVVLDNLVDLPVTLSKHGRHTGFRLVFSFSSENVWSAGSGSMHGRAERISKWRRAQEGMQVEGSIPEHNPRK